MNNKTGCRGLIHNGLKQVRCNCFGLTVDGVSIRSNQYDLLDGG
jgi:hypothetical protein